MHIQVPCNKTKSCRKSTIYRWNHGFSTSDVREYCSRSMETDPIGKYHPSTILVPHFSAFFGDAIFVSPGAVGSGEQNVAWRKKKLNVFHPEKHEKLWDWSLKNGYNQPFIYWDIQATIWSSQNGRRHSFMSVLMGFCSSQVWDNPPKWFLTGIDQHKLD